MAFPPRFCTNIGKKILAWQDVDMKLLEQVRQAWRDKHYLMSLQKNIIYAINWNTFLKQFGNCPVIEPAIVYASHTSLVSVISSWFNESIQ